MNYLKNFAWTVFQQAKNPVLRGSLIYTAASVFNAAIPFFILPVLTRHLTPEEYGVVSTFMVTSAILLLAIGLEQHGFISTNYYRLSGEELRKYVSSAWTISTVMLVLVVGVILIAANQFSDLLFLPVKWIVLASCMSYFQFISQLNLTIWQLENRPTAYGSFQISNSVVNYGISILLVVWFGLKDEGRMAGIIAASFLFGLGSFINLYQKGIMAFTFSQDVLRASLLFSLPLIPHSLAGWINTGLDRILINNMVSVSENGIYSISYQVAMLVGMVGSSFNRAFAPFIFKSLIESEAIDVRGRLVKYTYAYFIIMVLIVLLVYLASPLVIRFLVDDEFYGAEKYLLWIMLGFLFDSLYFGVVNYLFFIKKTQFISAITVTSCIIHFLVSYFLIPVYGAISAAYATAISYLFSFVATFYLSNKLYPMPWGLYLRRLYDRRFK